MPAATSSSGENLSQEGSFLLMVVAEGGTDDLQTTHLKWKQDQIFFIKRIAYMSRIL